MSAPDVSVIVPLHRLTPEARQCVETLVRLPGGRHETIVVSDTPVHGLPGDVRMLVTGADADTSPAEKRDAALPHVRGAICAFIDDDAYPAEDWIERALERFADPGIAAIGGPGLTPPGAGWRERLGGAFYESPLGSGSLRRRFVGGGRVEEIDDWPAYNFLVRTSVLRDVGGWASRFYGGEDTKLCLELVERGHRIVYDPDVVVYHHRRPAFRAHMRQVGNVGRHRGYFVRAFPATSARPVYFLPSAAVLAAPVVAAWSVRGRRRRRLAAAATGVAWAAVAADARRRGQEGSSALLLPLILAAGHGAYGVGFLRGLATREIEAM